MTDQRKAISVLTLNTLAFTVCFAAWTMNGVLVTFLVTQGVYDWTASQMGWLIGTPVLTGALMRLPVGILTDKYGGRVVYGLLMVIAAVFMYTVSLVNTYQGFLLASLGFGLSGASFAVGIAYTSVWFSKERQGTALGIFGAGNAGAAVTSAAAPAVLLWLTDDGANVEAWRTLPKLYAAALVAMALVFFAFTHYKKADTSHITSFADRLAPLRHMRVWRFGFYYFLVFGGFVGLAQWLVPYYVNAYSMSVLSAGMMATIFSLPSGVIRAVGGWMSDHWGARRVMYWVLGSCAICCALLIVPRMDIESPGTGVMAARAGVVNDVSADHVLVGDRRYELQARSAATSTDAEEGTLVMPTMSYWQEPVVSQGDEVVRRQLLAKGVTHIFFQANIWVFTGLVFVVGIMMGIGKAAVYKHIPEYFPRDVGVVGGIVGVLGGLGGFFWPILFGYLLEGTGIWTTSWMLLTVFSLACLWWMHSVIQRMHRDSSPELTHRFEQGHSS